MRTIVNVFTGKFDESINLRIPVNACTRKVDESIHLWTQVNVSALDSANMLIPGEQISLT